MSPPSQPSLAASRHGFRVSAANLYMGLATSGKWPVPFGIGIKSASSRTCSLLREQLAYIGSLLYAIDAIIGCLVMAGRTITTSRASSRVYCQRSGVSCDSRYSVFSHASPPRRDIAQELHTRKKDIARGSHQVRQMSNRMRFCVVWYADRRSVEGVPLTFTAPPCTVYSARSQRSGRAKRWNRKMGKIESVSLAISATMVLGLRSGINVLFPSVRAGCTWGFSIRSKVTRDDIMGSTVGEQQERGMSISGQNVPSAQLCLRARDVIQLGHSRVYAENRRRVGYFREYFGSGESSGCLRFDKSDGDSPSTFGGQR
ncbi:hypothetical protein EDB83DRAFT_2319593 [Lactarius deliciosus]|nr:hypothetical protein EDB83DRAFT_2319593 [Lactarius deliciosus]